MKKFIKFLVVALALLATATVTYIYIQNNNIAVLEPKGMIAEKESNLIITASLLMLIVVVPVLILTWFFAWRYRDGNVKARHTPDWEHNTIAEVCWWGIPLVIIGILAVITWKSTHELNPFEPIVSDKKAVKIQVVALQWKWLFIYPEQGIATVNFIQFPVDTPVNFEITADAPMNSFWIPQLGGMIYAMPAMRSKLHLIASEMGNFRGVSANLSGKGFAGMTFVAKSSSQADFEGWVGSVRQSKSNLTAESYKLLAMPSENNPVASYVLQDNNLFEEILMKYMPPAQ
ncbi:MAG: ubiquinol oxidase subunit II [Chlamydiae bacterium]|nr:ubiquinol oxidase subunit II [Chlamydiota bacterium]